MNEAHEVLKVLLVEDSPADAEIILRALKPLARRLEHERVVDEDGLRRALGEFSPHIVLSDYSMPGFGGQDALRVVTAVSPDIPFIFVSGTIGEDVAIDALQRGASDYVLKENLRRLQPAVERALRVAREKSERQRMERALQASEERFRSIVESTADWMWEMDGGGQLTYSNRSVADILGYAPEDLIGKDALHYLDDEQRDAAAQRIGADSGSGSPRGWRNWVLRWRHRDGSLRCLESTAQPLRDEQGRHAGYRGVDRDVTLRLQQEARIAQLGRIHAVLGALGNAVLRARSFEPLLGMICRLAVEHGQFKAAVIGLRMAQNQLQVGSHAGDRRVIDLISNAGPFSLTGSDPFDRPAIRAINENRNVIAHDYTKLPVADAWRQQLIDAGVVSHIALPLGKPAWGVLGLYSGSAQEFDAAEIDLLERLTAEIDHARDFFAKSERLEYLAYHNPDTGFPNRAAFQEALPALLQKQTHVVAMTDMDRFRHYSQSRGRDFAMRLLALVGERLRNLLPPEALFAHPEDDVFMFAYAEERGGDESLDEVEKLLASASAMPFLVDGEEVQVDLNASMLLAPAQGSEPEAIERNLTAMLVESHDRPRRALAFTETARQRAERRVEIERDLHQALQLNAFELYLQPKFATSTQALTGAEALLRWRHPTRGLVAPGDFLSILEESGLIVEAGFWVRRTALAITQRWRELGHIDLRLAVNVSARELRQLDFVTRCRRLLSKSEGEHNIDIEITESLLMDDIAHSIRVLQSLRDLGCRVSIDDFGTGYSSLNYLSRLPTDALKIDRSFIALIALSPDTLSLVTQIIGLAHSLGLKVVAEGVEDEEQAKLLRLLRCDELQGYFLGMPMTVEEFEQRFLG